MSSKVAAATVVFAVANAGPRYFLGQHYTITDPELPIAYPLDMCVNVELNGFGTTADDFTYSMYTCNDDGTVLTETSYGTDPDCEGSGEVINTYTDTSLPYGSQWSFNCTGSEDYVVYYNFRDEPTCCDFTPGTALPTMAATNLCYEYEFGSYTRFECDSEGNFQRETYTDSDCTNLATRDDYPDADDLEFPSHFHFNTSCSFWKTLFSFDVYRTLDTCMSAGEVIAEMDEWYCENGTSMEPTGTTDSGDDGSAAVMDHPWMFGLLAVLPLWWN